MSEQKLAANEYIKIRSNFLRGTLAEELTDVSTGAISEDSQQLIKFHGSYMQDDRDLRADRRKHRLEKAYSFMIRIRVPGGTQPRGSVCSQRLAAAPAANLAMRRQSCKSFRSSPSGIRSGMRGCRGT